LSVTSLDEEKRPRHIALTSSAVASEGQKTDRSTIVNPLKSDKGGHDGN